MNLEVADHIQEILQGQGYKTKMGTRDGQYIVAVFGAEGQDRDIRNAVPMFYWFLYWLHAQTIHEPDDRIIVTFD